MHTILSFDLLRAAFPLNNQRCCTIFFSVAGQKCCRFTFLQTTDMFNLYISCVSFRHFNNPCHIMFILHVHELMFMPGNGGDSAGHDAVEGRESNHWIFLSRIWVKPFQLCSGNKTFLTRFQDNFQLFLLQ